MPIHRFLTWLTAAVLAISLILAVAAWREHRDFDRASIALALLAGVTGLVFDRYLTAFDRRRDLLRALLYELYVAKNVFASDQMQPSVLPSEPQAYPHLPLACLSTCLASGAFTDARDTRLLKAMYEWRQRATEFNEKLLLTGSIGLTTVQAALASYHTSVTASNTTSLARSTLEDLYSVLLDNYHTTTGLTRDSTAFPAVGA